MSSYDFNQVILIGHLGTDPEMKNAGEGSKFVTFSMATNKSWTIEGIKHSHTDWHNVILNGRLVSVAEKQLRKGSKVFIRGELRFKSWQDKEGKKRFSVNVAAHEFRCLDPLPEKTETASSVDTTLQGIPEMEMPDIPF